MKRILAIPVIFLLLWNVLWSSPPVLAAGETTLATLSSIKGEAVVQRGGGLREFPAQDGMPLRQGDFLRTGDNSTVKIIFGNGSETMLGSNTQLRLAKLTTMSSSQGFLKHILGRNSYQVNLSIWAGSIWNKIKSLVNANDEYKVETPTVVMGVRGTEFGTTIDSATGATTTRVMDGQVAVKPNTEQSQASAEQTVSMGQELEVKSNTDPMPSSSELDKEKLVQTTEPQMLAQIVVDVMARVGELLEQAKQAHQDFQQSKNNDQIKSAIILAEKSTQLASLAKDVVNTVQASDKVQDVQAALQVSNQTLEQVQTTIQTTQEQTQETKQQVVETAKEAGLKPDEIQTIVDSVTSGTSQNVAPPAPEAPPAPAPEPAPNPNPSPTSNTTPSPEPVQDNNDQSSDNSVPVTSIAITYNGTTYDSSMTEVFTLGMNSDKQFTATVSPTDATNRNVAWSSSNASVATVDQTGKVTPQGIGTAVITAAAQDGSHVFSNFNVTVAQPTAAGTLVANTLDNGGLYDSGDLTLKYITGENFTNGRVSFNIPSALDYNGHNIQVDPAVDMVRIGDQDTGSGVTLATLIANSQASVQGNTINIYGVTLSKGKPVVLQLGNKPVPQAGKYVFMASGDADGSGLAKGNSSQAGGETVTLYSQGMFTQGAAFQAGAYEPSAAQPATYNWNRKSRFNGPDIPVLKGSNYLGSTVGFSGMVVDKNKTALAGAQNVLYAFNPDASLRWTFNVDNNLWIKDPPVIGQDTNGHANIYFKARDYTNYTEKIYSVAEDVYSHNPQLNSNFPVTISSGSTGYGLSGLAMGGDGSIYYTVTDTVANDNVAGRIYKLDPNAASGSQLYRTVAGDSNVFDYTSTPVIASNGDIFVVLGNVLYGVKADGSQWSHVLTGTGNFQTPVLGVDPANPGKSILYVPFSATDSYNGGLEALDPATGTAKWPAGFQTVGAVLDAPAVTNNGSMIVFTTIPNTETGPSGKVYALQPDGSEIWEFPRAGSQSASDPAISFSHAPLIGQDGTVYAMSDNGVLYALNANDGNVLPSWPYSVGPTGGDSAPVIGARNLIYLVSSDGQVYTIGSGRPNISNVSLIDKNADNAIDQGDWILIGFNKDLDAQSEQAITSELGTNVALGSGVVINWNDSHSAQITLGSGAVLSFSDAFALNRNSVYDAQGNKPNNDPLAVLPPNFNPLLSLANGDGVDNLNGKAPGGPQLSDSSATVPYNIMTFKITAQQENVTVDPGNHIAIDLSNIKGLTQDDFSGIQLFEDAVGNGIPDSPAAPVAVGTMGPITPSAGDSTVGTGRITFTIPSGGTINLLKDVPRNYILQLILKNWNVGDTFAIANTRSIHVWGHGANTGLLPVMTGGISGQNFEAQNVLNAPPTLTADNTGNDAAHDIVIAFTDADNWAANVTGVSVNDGTTTSDLDATKYTVNGPAGTLTIHAGVLSTGSYTITVKAAGFRDATVSQVVTLGISRVTITDADNSNTVNQGDRITVVFSDNLAANSQISIAAELQGIDSLGDSSARASVAWSNDKTAVITLGNNPTINLGGSFAITRTNVFDSHNNMPVGNLAVNILSQFNIATGYTVTTSDDTGGPVFDYIDVAAGPNTYYSHSDDDYIQIPIGFNFNFYGSDYNQVFIGTNGYLTFGQGDSTFTNYAFPATGAPRIAPFFDDLIANRQYSGIYYRTEGSAPNRKLIVQWREEDHYSSSPNTVDFEAILYEGTNEIIFQYLDTTFGDSNDYGSSATVGLDKGDGQSAVLFSYNYPSLKDGLAIKFTPSALNLSTMTVGTSTVTPTQNVAFTLTITEAKGTNGNPLTGATNVTVTSSNVNEDLSAITSVTLNNGNGVIPLTLTQTGAQTLTVRLTGVTAGKTVDVTVQSAVDETPASAAMNVTPSSIALGLGGAAVPTVTVKNASGVTITGNTKNGTYSLTAPAGATANTDYTFNNATGALTIFSASTVAGTYTIQYINSTVSNVTAQADVSVMAAAVVRFPDANLESVVRTALNKPSGDIINLDMAGLTALTAEIKGIGDLTGLEYAVNLQLP